MTKYVSAFRKKRGVPSIPKVKTMYQRGLETLLQKLLVVFIGLVIYRFGTLIPIPGISAEAWSEHFKTLVQKGNLLANLNTVSGGALNRGSIFALGVGPYISASILMRFFTLSFPKLKAMQSEGSSGREKVNQYMRYMAVALSFVQGLAAIMTLTGRFGSIGGEDCRKFLAMDGNGLQIYCVMIPAFMGGAAFLMWLSEQMTEYGIGNGTSFIIFSGIVASLPGFFHKIIESIRQGSIGWNAFLPFTISSMILLYFMTFLELTYRRIPIQYAQGRDLQKRLIPMPESSLPLKFNVAEIMPVMVANVLINVCSIPFRYLANNWMDWEIVRLFSPFILALLPRSEKVSMESNIYFQILNALFISIACFLYAGINFDCWESADHLKKDKAVIPGIRPGAQTSFYLKRLVDRITRLSAVYCVIIACVLPYLSAKLWGPNFVLGGISFLIVIGVVVEILESISTHIYSHQYEALMARTHFWKLKC